MANRQSTAPPPSNLSKAPPPTSPFFTQREALINDISLAMEHVLQNINKLNRNLEGVIAVGNEFGNVEALWSQFEGVMAKDDEGGKKGEDGDEDDGEVEGEGEVEQEEHQAEAGGKRPNSKGAR